MERLTDIEALVSHYNEQLAKMWAYKIDIKHLELALERPDRDKTKDKEKKEMIEKNAASVAKIFNLLVTINLLIKEQEAKNGNE